MAVTFEGNLYEGERVVGLNGDTTTYYHPVGTVRPGKLYEYKSILKKGNNGKTSKITTNKESGELFPSDLATISPTSTWGQTLQSYFPTQGLPIRDSFLRGNIRKLFGFKQGGLIPNPRRK